MNQTIQQLFERKSVRSYLGKAITPAEKQLILDSALQAPTAGNMCLYSIIDVTDQALKDQLAVLCDNQPFIAKASLVLVFIGDFDKLYNAYKLVLNNDEIVTPQVGDMLLACEDAVIAAQNSVVAAESLGIGSCYIGDVLENCDKICELFKLPKFTIPISMLVYGYPTTQQLQRQKPNRFATAEIVFENYYQQKNLADFEKMFDHHQASQSGKEAIAAIYKRKYDTDYRQEMNRSALKHVKRWMKDEETSDN